MAWMRTMVPTELPADANRRAAMKASLRKSLLVTAAISTLMTGYLGGYIALRKADVINDSAQQGYQVLFGQPWWATVANVGAMPIYWLELRWRFARMDERWQHGVDRGFCPEGERTYGDRWAQFWYRQGYLDAIPCAMTSAICGYATFSGPMLDIPAASYQIGMFDGERVVQKVVRDFLVEHGVPRWNGQAKPVDYDSAIQVEFTGSPDEHAQFQAALNALRQKFAVRSSAGSSESVD